MVTDKSIGEKMRIKCFKDATNDKRLRRMYAAVRIVVLVILDDLWEWLDAGHWMLDNLWGWQDVGC